MNHMICSSAGDQIADGLTEEQAQSRAQALANELGASVYIYGDDDTDETATEVTPSL